MSDKAPSHTSRTSTVDPEKHAIETSSLSSEPVATHVDPALDKVVWRKLDMWILPVVAMFYFLSFLVRPLIVVNSGYQTEVCALRRIGLILPTHEWLDCKQSCE
jgi:hypothetical protein